MKASNVMKIFAHAIKQVEAAIDSGEITPDSNVSCSFTPQWEIILTSNGRPLKFFCNEKNADFTARWELEANKELEDLKISLNKQHEDKIKRIINEIDSTKDKISKLVIKANERTGETEYVNPDKTSCQENYLSLQKKMRDLEEKLEKTQGVNTSDGLPEETMMKFNATEYMYKQILQFLKEASREPAIATALSHEWKNWPRLIKSINKRAQDLLSCKGNGYVSASDHVVYSWVHDYLLYDDKTEVEDEERIKTENAEKRRLQSLKSEYDKKHKELKSLKRDFKELSSSPSESFEEQIDKNEKIARIENEIDNLEKNLLALKEQIPEDYFAKKATKKPRKTKAKSKKSDSTEAKNPISFSNEIASDVAENEDEKNTIDESTQMSLFDMVV
jgi:uncharacterized coiled-coil DUF342 family protein